MRREGYWSLPNLLVAQVPEGLREPTYFPTLSLSIA